MMYWCATKLSSSCDAKVWSASTYWCAMSKIRLGFALRRVNVLRVFDVPRLKVGLLFFEGVVLPVRSRQAAGAVAREEHRLARSGRCRSAWLTRPAAAVPFDQWRSFPGRRCSRRDNPWKRLSKLRFSCTMKTMCWMFPAPVLESARNAAPLSIEGGNALRAPRNNRRGARSPIARRYATSHSLVVRCAIVHRLLHEEARYFGALIGLEFTRRLIEVERVGSRRVRTRVGRRHLWKAPQVFGEAQHAGGFVLHVRYVAFASRRARSRAAARGTRDRRNLRREL